MFNPQKAYFSRDWMRRWTLRLQSPPNRGPGGSRYLADHGGPQPRIDARFHSSFHATRSA